MSSTFNKRQASLALLYGKFYVMPLIVVCMLNRNVSSSGVSTPLARGSDEASQYSIFGPSPSFSQGPELAAATGRANISKPFRCIDPSPLGISV